MRYLAGDNVNPLWSKSERGKLLTARRAPIMGKDSKIFTMGSCFAYEIRKALRAKNIRVYPDWFGIEFNPETQVVGRLPDLDNIAHYDTFVILQELKDALEEPKLAAEDFLQLPVTKQLSKIQSSGPVWQDPYRKLVYANSFENVQDISRKFSRCVREGLEQSDCFIITLGLIETWRNPKNGRFFCKPPGTGFNNGYGRETGEFHLSNYEENLRNLREIISLLQTNFSGKPIVVSVSPVALNATFSKEDIIVANTYSKAVLRAVVGQVMQELPENSGVYYMPSYEIAQRADIFEEDGRHVTEGAAQFIVSLFDHMFLEQAEQPAAQPAKQSAG